jgi:anti-sigma factor RsiW
MNCNISGSEWTDYLDGVLRHDKFDKVHRHVSTCAACSEKIQTMRDVEGRLRSECSLLLQRIRVSETAMDASLRRILALADTGAQTVGAGEREGRLWRVRWVLSLLCGSNTATRVIHAARPVEASKEISEQNWQTFLDRLAALTTEICGHNAAKLIWLVGK